MIFPVVHTHKQRLCAILALTFCPSFCWINGSLSGSSSLVFQLASLICYRTEPFSTCVVKHSMFAINTASADVCVRLTGLTGKLRVNVRTALFEVVEGIDG
jgi:hypothetical protein